MSERAIIEQQIEDHQKAIDKAKAELEKLEVTYSIGDRFVMSQRGSSYEGQKFIIVESDDGKGVKLASLRDGERWAYKQDVKDTRRITSDEFNKIGDNKDFTRYWDARKKEKC
jgi:hypothetical protein